MSYLAVVQSHAFTGIIGAHEAGNPARAQALTQHTTHFSCLRHSHTLYIAYPFTPHNTPHLSLMSHTTLCTHNTLPTGLAADQGQYTYTAQLLELDSCRPEIPAGLSPALEHIQTPARLDIWKQELAGHPDQRFAEFILKGLSSGFRIGFQHQSSRLRQAGSNMRITEPQVVSDYIAEELRANRLVELTEKEAAVCIVAQ